MLSLALFLFPSSWSLPSHFMPRLLMLATNCNVQGTTANLPNVFLQTRCKKISEESQDTFTCQTTNVKASGGGRGYKLRGLIHNHSAAKTFSTDASGQHICHYEGFWHILITGQRYGMMMLLREVGRNSVPEEYGHYPPSSQSISIFILLGILFIKNQSRNILWYYFICIYFF